MNEANDMKGTLSLAVAFLAAAVVINGCSSPPTPSVVGLHEAALTGNTDALAQHIAAGSDLNQKDPYGSTPLIVAATFGRTDAATALIEAGADISIPNNEGSSPLHVAAFLCHTDIVKALLVHGADIDAKNNDGNTPLESVAGPFDDVKGIYDAIGGALGPLGLKLDYDLIKATRPQIAQMLRERSDDQETVG